MVDAEEEEEEREDEGEVGVGAVADCDGVLVRDVNGDRAAERRVQVSPPETLLRTIKAFTEADTHRRSVQP